MGNNLKIVLLQIVTLRDFQPLQNRIVCDKTLSEKVSDLCDFHLLSLFSCTECMMEIIYNSTFSQFILGH